MEWYPTPSYLVKRRVILDYLATCHGRRVLEVGCGCGDLLRVLERKGYTGLGIDISVEALELAQAGFSGSGFQVRCTTPEYVNETFDVVIASEVMEHCPDDMLFLSVLQNRLRSGGHLLMTVPAHMKDWGANDELCGHIKRYERHELRSMLERTGFEDIVICSYGVPVYNIMKPLYDRAVCARSCSGETASEKTVSSAGMIILTKKARLFRFLFNDVTMFPFYCVQKLFYRTDAGKGYFIAARTKEQQ